MADKAEKDIQGQSPGSQVKDKLGLKLISQGFVEADVIEKALRKREEENAGTVSRRSKRSLAQILVEDFNVDHDLVFSAMSQVYGFHEVQIGSEDTNEYRIEFMKKMFDPVSPSTREYMIQKKILAYRYDPDRPYRLILIAADPTDRMIPAIARSMNVQSYDICYVKYSDMEMLMEKVFPPENKFLKDLEEGEISVEAVEDEEEGFDEALIEAEINKSMLVNLVEGMLIEAVRMGASDIHVVPVNATTTDVTFRIDGMLRPWHTQEGIRPEAISAVIKDRSKNIDRFEREMSQDGFIQRKIDGHHIRYRVSVIPIVGREFQYKFESIVIRILDDRKVITDLDKLGLQGGARQAFLKAIHQPQGMIIVTGPTGSGKSTTLIAALSYVVNPEINVLTVEDPVEYIIPNVRQLKISHKMAFEQALRGILRHDPDVVMLGEIRDKETGETAIKMANTGHLTFSTLHTNDAPSAVSRLFKMGIETFLIAYAINIIIAQRLVRTLCKECKIPIDEEDKSIGLQLGFTQEELDTIPIFKPNHEGCDKCHGGYKGRAGIHEALYFTKEIRKLIFEAKSDINEDAIRQKAIEQGMLPLQAAARERVKEGITSFEEVARVTSED
ncbi:MAG: GspE/PulE family protein [bacterium]